MHWIFEPQIWVALITLTILEIVLGIDNIVFISILAGKLPQNQQKRARYIGLALAMLTRIVLLFSLTLIMKLTAPLFSIFHQEISGRDLILIIGGLFLLGKSTYEIHEKLEGTETQAHGGSGASFTGVVIQIGILDIIFSLDSVITAIGMANQLAIMIAAVILAVIFMLISVNAVSDFVDKHPTVKMLALSFLLLIGTTLIADGLDMHVPKGYIYFAMGFSVFVEMLNLRLKQKMSRPLRLKQKYLATEQ